MLTIRHAQSADRSAAWAILEPVIRAGETYTLPRELSREDALAFWFAAEHEAFVAEENGVVVGIYFLQANQRGGGAPRGELRIRDGSRGDGAGRGQRDV